MKSSGFFSKRKVYVNFGYLFLIMGIFIFAVGLFPNYFNIKQSPIVIFGVSIFHILLALLAVKLANKKYFPCPYCDKSILAVYDWTCDHCHNKQGKSEHIGEPCNHCKRSLETYTCGFCGEEFKL